MQFKLERTSRLSYGTSDYFLRLYKKKKQMKIGVFQKKGDGNYEVGKKEKERHVDDQYITLFKKKKENGMYLHSQFKTTCLGEF